MSFFIQARVNGSSIVQAECLSLRAQNKTRLWRVRLFLVSTETHLDAGEQGLRELSLICGIDQLRFFLSV